MYQSIIAKIKNDILIRKTMVRYVKLSNVWYVVLLDFL